MILTEIILVLILLGFAAGGWKDGFVSTFGRFIGALIGFLLAMRFSGVLEPLFGAFLSDSWAKLVAFLLIFLLITRLIGFLFGLLGGVTKFLSHIPGIGLINNITGGIMGFLEGIVMIGGAIWLFTTSNIFPKILSALSGSAVAGWIQSAFQVVLSRLPSF